MSQTLLDGVLYVVVFSLNDDTSAKKEYYAIPVEQMREILPFETVTKIPSAEKYVRGMVNLRGKVIPIIDVKEKIGLGSLSKTNTTKSRILVADYEGNLTGLLIDEADQVMRVSLKDLEELHSDSLGSVSYVKGIIKVEGKLIALFDVPKLLAKEETR